MVHYIPYPVSTGLERENAIHQALTQVPTPEELRCQWPSVEAYCAPFLDSSEGAQFLAATARLPKGARILDIGAGEGRQAFALAARGYEVAVAEPSASLCEYISTAALAFGLDVAVYCVTGEGLDALPEASFEACIFHASLHHCDEPEQALANCYRLLVPGGRLLVLNEPHLQGFRSKAWFQRQIERGALVSGDYGGNEHTYYYREYRAMLEQAGFAPVHDALSVRYRHPRSYLRVLDEAGAPWQSRWARKLYYLGIAALCRSGPLGRPLLNTMKRCSLLQTNYFAEKPAVGQAFQPDRKTSGWKA